MDHFHFFPFFGFPWWVWFILIWVLISAGTGGRRMRRRRRTWGGGGGVCSSCGAAYGPQARFCPKCGNSL